MNITESLCQMLDAKTEQIKEQRRTTLSRNDYLLLEKYLQDLRIMGKLTDNDVWNLSKFGFVLAVLSNKEDKQK